MSISDIIKGNKRLKGEEWDEYKKRLRRENRLINFHFDGTPVHESLQLKRVRYLDKVKDSYGHKTVVVPNTYRKEKQDKKCSQ